MKRLIESLLLEGLEEAAEDLKDEGRGPIVITHTLDQTHRLALLEVLQRLSSMLRRGVVLTQIVLEDQVGHTPAADRLMTLLLDAAGLDIVRDVEARYTRRSEVVDLKIGVCSLTLPREARAGRTMTLTYPWTVVTGTATQDTTTTRTIRDQANTGAVLPRPGPGLPVRIMAFGLLLLWLGRITDSLLGS